MHSSDELPEGVLRQLITDPRFRTHFVRPLGLVTINGSFLLGDAGLKQHLAQR
jgi:hypothetical protein